MCKLLTWVITWCPNSRDLPEEHFQEAQSFFLSKRSFQIAATTADRQTMCSLLSAISEGRAHTAWPEILRLHCVLKQEELDMSLSESTPLPAGFLLLQLASPPVVVMERNQLQKHEDSCWAWVVSLLFLWWAGGKGVIPVQKLAFPCHPMAMRESKGACGSCGWKKRRLGGAWGWGKEVWG